MSSRRGRIREYATGISVLARTLDVLTCFITGVLAYFVRFGSFDLSSYLGYPVLIFVGGMLVLMVFPLTGLYQSWRTRTVLAPAARALVGWIVVFAALMVLLVLVKRSERFSREWLTEWFGLQAVLLVIIRLALYAILRRLRRRGYNRRYVVLVGDGAQARELGGLVGGAISTGFEVVATFSGDDEARLPGNGAPHALTGLGEYLSTHTVDEVWIALPLEERQKLRDVVLQCGGVASNIRYVPDLRDLYLLNHGVTDVLGVPMIDLRTSPMQGANAIWKELEDRVLAALILIIVSPLMLAIAGGVKLTSRGPVFYKQERAGWNGRTFMMLKFRSMRADAEARTGAVWASRRDDRTTGFGAFLRRTSLDELPQFLNVLKGDMSVVGPRPERPVFVEKFKSEIPNYMPRHLMKAGITGWAQVNGWRGNTDLRKRVEHDLYYIDNWSLWFDIKIIWLTLFRGFVNKNAY